jgi:16S rRNA processing protein RimM
LRPQGRKGELLADLLTDLDPAVQFATGRSVALVPAHAASPSPADQAAAIESFFLPTGKNAGRIVLKLNAANSISEAERLAGLQLLVQASELPSLDADTYYVRDLIGCSLLNKDKLVGEITDVEFAMAPDGRTRLEDAPPLLLVRLEPTPDGIEPTAIPPETALIPFAKNYLVSVDLPAKQIVMSLPDGLLDDQANAPPGN